MKVVFSVAIIALVSSTSATSLNQRSTTQLHQHAAAGGDWWGSAEKDDEIDHSKEYFRAEDSVTDEDL